MLFAAASVHRRATLDPRQNHNRWYSAPIAVPDAIAFEVLGNRAVQMPAIEEALKAAYRLMPYASILQPSV
jgi:hypothetical protein